MSAGYLQSLRWCCIRENTTTSSEPHKHLSPCAWAAPGRVNLIGEHTDYNDGFVLPLALPQRVTAKATPNNDGLLRVHSRQRGDRGAEFDLDGLAPGMVEGWQAYVAGVVWALRQTGHPLRGLDLVIDGDVPAGAGLSSSAALECAVALAVNEMCELELDRFALARLAQQAENDFVGMPCGIMDQAASLLSRVGHALFLDTRTLMIEQVPLELDAASLALLVVDTRAPHRLVEGEYAARRRECEHGAAALGLTHLRDLDVTELPQALQRLRDETIRRRVRHVVTENARVLETVDLLRAGRTDAIGPLLTASHESLRDDFEVTVPELDITVDAALRSGALGSRMTGAGFGGCVIALVPSDMADHVADTVREALREHGYAEPASFAATASAGAGRVDP